MSHSHGNCHATLASRGNPVHSKETTLTPHTPPGREATPRESWAALTPTRKDTSQDGSHRWMALTDRHKSSEVSTRRFRQHPECRPGSARENRRGRFRPPAPRPGRGATAVAMLSGQSAVCEGEAGSDCQKPQWHHHPFPALSPAQGREGGRLPWGGCPDDAVRPEHLPDTAPRWELSTGGRGRCPSGGKHAVAAEIWDEPATCARNKSLLA